MTSRRGFFRKLAGFAATVALAPQLCFKVKPELPGAGLDELFDQIHTVQFNRPDPHVIDIFTDRLTAERISKAFQRYYVENRQ